MLFEIEKDGQKYQLDAPDMQTAASALQSYSGGQQQEQKKTYEWSDLPANIVPSAVNTATGLINTIAHPIQTAENVYNNPGAAVSAITEPFVHPRTAIISDPVGSALAYSGAADLAGLGAKGAAAAGKLGAAGSAAAKAGSVLSKASEISDVPFQVARLAGKTVQKTPDVFNKIAGSASATGEAPASVTAAAAQGGKVAQLVNAAISKKLPSDFEDKMINTGRAQIKAKARNELNAALNPMRDEPVTAGVRARLQDALDRNKPLAFHAGKPRADAVPAQVYNQIQDKIDSFISPAGSDQAKLNQLLAAQRTGKPFLARDIMGDQAVTDVGGNPSRMTANDFINAWGKLHRTVGGLDELRRQVEGVYKGYLKEGGAANATAAKISGDIVDEIKNIVGDNTAAKFGSTYKDALQRHGELRGILNKFDQTFGFKEDTRTRRITQINRDGLYTNFGLRLKVLRDMQQHAPALQGIEHVGAARALSPITFRNLVSGLGSGAFLGYFMGPTSPLTLASLAVHVPRVVGRSSYLMGATQRWIGKPLGILNKAMKATGITPHGVSLGAGLTGNVAGHADVAEQFKNALQNEAQKAGYNIHESVLRRTAQNLMSEDIDTFMRALKTVSGHKRMMQLIANMARTKGEQQ